MSVFNEILIFLAAATAGFINAMAGGGTLVSFPVLLAVGISPVVANVTNTVALVPGTIGGMWAQRDHFLSQRTRLLKLLPVAILGGVAGAYFQVLTNTMIITLICSFLVTWLCLPVVYIWLADLRALFPEKKKDEIKITRTRNWVGFFLQRPYISILFILIALASIIYILPRLETGFLPEMDEGAIVLDYLSPPGTSLDETDKILIEVEKILFTIPEVETYSRRTGAQMGFFITEPNNGDYLIHLKNDRTRSTEEVIDDIRKRVEATQPALQIDFGQVIGDMLGDLMASVQPYS